MRETTLNNQSKSSFLLDIFSIFGQVWHYWVLERETKSEEFFAFVTLMFGIYEVQSKNTIEILVYAPPVMGIFDDAIGVALIVISLLYIRAVWTRNREWRITLAFINIFIWATLAVMFILKGVDPAAYILPVYVLYLFVAYLRNSWEAEHGTIKQYTDIPKFALERCSDSDNRGVGYPFSFILKAAFSEILEKGRHRNRADQNRI